MNNCLQYKIYSEYEKSSNRRNRGFKRLLKEQQIVLKEYFDFLLGGGHKGKMLSHNTIYNVIECVSLLGKDIRKPYSKMTKKDLMQYFSNCRMPKDEEKKGLKEGTILTRKASIRNFFRWLYENENAEIVAWINVTMNYKNKIDKSQLLTPEEIKGLINSADNKRDACMVAVAYECGLRAGRIGWNKN